MACRLCTTKGGFIVFTEVLLLVLGVLVLFGLLYFILRQTISLRRMTLRWILVERGEWLYSQPWSAVKRHSLERSYAASVAA